MPTHIPAPTRIEAAGNKPKLIDEYVGRVTTKTEAVSVAHMRSPAGWVEPGQTPEFSEYTVVLDTAIDASLRREGVARDAINLFNNVRKDKGFEVSDRVAIAWECSDEEVSSALTEHASLVAREVLASQFEASSLAGGGDELELARTTLRYSITRAP